MQASPPSHCRCHPHWESSIHHITQSNSPISPVMITHHECIYSHPEIVSPPLNVIRLQNSNLPNPLRHLAQPHGVHGENGNFRCGLCVCTATIPDSGLVNAFESQLIWYTIDAIWASFNASYTGYKNSTLYIYLYLLPESCPNAGF